MKVNWIQVGAVNSMTVCSAIFSGYNATITQVFAALGVTLFLLKCGE